MANSMYEALAAFSQRPRPFSVYTADLLWTDPHISARMLDLHLDGGNDLASRSTVAIEHMVGWLDRALGFAGKAVCDLGCGPGLYATRVAGRGARVIGLDFSSRSIEYARQSAHSQRGRKASGLDLVFERADYLKDDLPTGQDLICLIYGDPCALSPDQRRVLYAKVHASLKPGGRFVLDVFSLARFRRRASIPLQQVGKAKVARHLVVEQWQRLCIQSPIIVKVASR